MAGFKGVAVTQIILLVLGILVLAVVAFLLYQNFFTAGNQIDFQTCQAVEANICASCAGSSGGTGTGCTAGQYLTDQQTLQCVYQHGILGINNVLSGTVTALGAGGTPANPGEAVSSYRLDKPETLLNCGLFGGGVVVQQNQQQQNNNNNNACDCDVLPLTLECVEVCKAGS